MRGKLIVLEGVDASGKHTQAKILAKKLKALGFPVELAVFPSYATPFGKLVKKYLQGKFGDKDSLPPEIPAMLYAADRLQHKKEMESKLKANTWIVADRYVYSNLYQAAKIKGEKERARFMDWLEELEKSMPQADAVVFLDLSPELSAKLLRKRRRKKDLHEKDAAYLKHVHALYSKEAKKGKWLVVECSRNGRLRGKKEIAEEIFEKVGKKVGGRASIL